MSRKTTLDLTVFIAILGLAPACTPEDEDLVDDESAVVEADDESDLIDLDGLRIVAPPPGTSVWTERVYDDGTMRHVMLHTDLAGVVFVEEPADEHPADALDLAAPAPAPTAASVCSDGAYNLNPYKWTETLEWRFHSGTTPDGMNVDTVESKLKAGMSNITGSDNSCDLSDQVSATHKYLGRKSTGANIDSSGDCTDNDGLNMVSFGNLPEGTLGVACVWFSGSTAVNADIKFNKADHKWTTSPTSDSCSNRFSVEAVMTHEAGHAFGLAHVSEGSHPNLTMSTQTAPCQNGESTLGRGDVLGLRARY